MGNSLLYFIIIIDFIERIIGEMVVWVRGVGFCERRSFQVCGSYERRILNVFFEEGGGGLCDGFFSFFSLLITF